MRDSLKPLLVLLVAVSTLGSIVRAEEFPRPGRLADGSTVPSDALFTWAAPPSPRAMIPKYPEKFMRAGIGGIFEGDALISDTGEVIEVRVQNGIRPDFDKAVIANVKKVRFSPAVLNGERVASLYRLVFDFTPGTSRKTR